MKKLGIILFCAWVTLCAHAQRIDMQAHVASDEGRDAYTDYTRKQDAYYTGTFSPEALHAASGDDLFGLLNTLMGNTCGIVDKGLSYNSLRDAYVNVDRDLNYQGNIIGYYDGYSFAGVWDSGKTWNREHTWPQSKGADKDIPMGHDMQSVRPTRTAVNSSRGNTPYGEGYDYYDPDSDCKINNSYYKPSNMGTYRGDAARVILYDYIVYGEAGNHKNRLYNSNAQLLNKLGKAGVFESVQVLLKWHMQDPPSLTEMVRNDGAEQYQGNRNPFIDYPELAILMLQDETKTYSVTTMGVNMYPNYTLTTGDGFVAYLGTADAHPVEIDVQGTTDYSYDSTTGRLVISKSSANVCIIDPNAEPTSLSASDRKIRDTKIFMNGHVLILHNGILFDLMGRLAR